MGSPALCLSNLIASHNGSAGSGNSKLWIVLRHEHHAGAAQPHCVARVDVTNFAATTTATTTATAHIVVDRPQSLRCLARHTRTRTHTHTPPPHTPPLSPPPPPPPIAPLLWRNR